MHGICYDTDGIGTAFFIMDMVDGRIFWDATFPDVKRDDRPAYFDAMNRSIADLHKVDVAAAGLADFGKQSNYFARQIGRFSDQYCADEEAGRIPEMDKLADWLAANIPTDDEKAIVHGDFRCDNMIFHLTRPEVIGYWTGSFPRSATRSPTSPITL